MIRLFLRWIRQPIAEEVCCFHCSGWGCRHCGWTGRVTEIDAALLLVKGLPMGAVFWLLLWAVWTITPA